MKTFNVYFFGQYVQLFIYDNIDQLNEFISAEGFPHNWITVSSIYL